MVRWKTQEEKPCLQCGTFYTGYTVTKYCCDECRKEAARIRANVWYRERREDLLEIRREHSKKFRRENPEARLLAGAKNRAKAFGLDFDISIEDIVIPEVCPIMKVPFKQGTRFAPSLDKIDPSAGYTKGNVWVISRIANAMKQDASKEELEAFAKWVENESRVW